MKFADLVATRMKAIDALEKRMSARPTRELADQLGKATAAAQIERIELRIARLDRHKAATLARIDAALANENEALTAARKRAKEQPGMVSKGGSDVASPKSAKPAKPAAKATRSKSAAKATRSKSAKPR
ncbi:hypothetical protein OK349_04515 [Sphingomonas sp. BT-65]|uniref:hypothetical protein n=1 Tax=Sphingomonas sp. BT-65 TaxID=2989821 RepID=UPI00223691B5|nr:hypothetical protein [Sphingomonas sp. BT-65]MCW4460959.1 hypothetical protein [Sphingomonas sp. BT-65]